MHVGRAPDRLPSEYCGLFPVWDADVAILCHSWMCGALNKTPQRPCVPQAARPLLQATWPKDKSTSWPQRLTASPQQTTLFSKKDTLSF